jgi:hypothetical protein
MLVNADGPIDARGHQFVLRVAALLADGLLDFADKTDSKPQRRIVAHPGYRSWTDLAVRSDLPGEQN